MIGWPKRILIHDYPGHPFQVRLSRLLAEQGHRIGHFYSADVATPKTDAAERPGLELHPLSLGKPLAKYAFARRAVQEARYALRLYRAMLRWRPDVILSAAPPLPQLAAVLAGRRLGVPVVAWVQDIFCLGMRHVTRSWPAWRRRPMLAALERVEFGAIAAADARVLISPDFQAALDRAGLPSAPTAVIENWPALDGRPTAATNSDWGDAHGLAGKFVFLVSGTLGLKHNPGHLVALAEALRDDAAARVVVVSQGLGRQWLEQAKQQRRLDNLILHDHVPLTRLPQVLASADVTIMLLEPFAGELSVPSKLYTYLWAGHPILAAVPADNLAHRRVRELGAGLCVAPEDSDAFVAAALRLRHDAGLRLSCRQAIAAHADTAFDMDALSERFLDLFAQLKRR